MNDITIVTTVLAGAASICAIMFGYAAFKRNTTKDAKQDGAQFSAILVKLEVISTSISELKVEISSVRDEVRSLRDRLIAVEQSAKSLHHRVDALEGNPTRDYRK